MGEGVRPKVCMGLGGEAGSRQNLDRWGGVRRKSTEFFMGGGQDGRSSEC